MDLKSIAKSLEMSVCEFAEAAGYSRQELYMIIDGKRKPKKEKFANGMQNIKKISGLLYEEGMKEVVEKNQKRNELIRELEGKAE